MLWLQRMLLLDALAYLGGAKLATPLDRFILVDVDDIFVAKTGVRMTDDDVKVIIIYHDFLPTPRRGSHVKSDKTHTQSSRYTP